MKNKRGYANLILLIMFLIVIVLLAIWIFSKEASKPPKEISDCEDLQDLYFKNACFMELAITNQDETLCSGITDQNQQDLCFLAIAKAKNDTLICELISDEDYLEIKCYNELE